MAASRLVRATERNAERVTKIAKAESRTFIAQLDLIIDAGITALQLDAAAADAHGQGADVRQSA